MLDVQWLGLRPDLFLYSGPLDRYGQRTWVLEDPVRGEIYRLNYMEGELLFRLRTQPDPDSALSDLYATSSLRPSIIETVAFIRKLQAASLTNLPSDVVIEREIGTHQLKKPSAVQKIMQGMISFRITLFKPDRFLNRTFPWISLLWHPVCRWTYMICGLIGVIYTVQEVELYLSTVNYLFTPQGSLAFIACLVLLKIGHEFAHAYAAKALGAYVRSMGIIFIVFWPLLYTDTTDVWKVEDRKKRMLVSSAGIFFEMTVAGMALFIWTLLPDGILKSLMFFLSGTSLVSSIMINLNPFMRFDGYYVLMDAWGIDNLRPRSIAMVRHGARRLILDWQGPPPEHHPKRLTMMIYGILALAYRIVIAVSIALAVYYLFIPTLGLALLLVEFWMMIIRPLWIEVLMVFAQKQLLGSRWRLAVSGTTAALILFLLVIPVSGIEKLPCLFLYKGATKIKTPDTGRLLSDLPEIGTGIRKNQILVQLENQAFSYELQKAEFDLQSVRAKISAVGSGGEQGGYRNWLMAEEKRLIIVCEKHRQAIAQLEMKSPISGIVVDVNEKLYKGAFLQKDEYLFTLADTRNSEVKAYVHEQQFKDVDNVATGTVKVRVPGIKGEWLTATYREKNLFPVRYLPNDSLLDISGGPLTSVHGTGGERPRDSYFAITFDLQENAYTTSHGVPSWIWIRSEATSVMGKIAQFVWNDFSKRGII